MNEKFDYPSLEKLKENFHTISSLTYQKLLEATDDKLTEKFPLGMNVPFFEENVLNFIGMCIGREDYLCGQIGLMRKILGYEAMKYDVNETIPY